MTLIPASWQQSFSAEDWQSFVEALRAIAGDGDVRVSLMGTNGTITGAVTVGPDGVVRLLSPAETLALSPAVAPTVCDAQVALGEQSLNRFFAAMEANGVLSQRVWGTVLQAAVSAGLDSQFYARYDALAEMLRVREQQLHTWERDLGAHVASVMARERQVEVERQRALFIAEQQQHMAHAELYALQTRGAAQTEAQRLQYYARLRASEGERLLAQAKTEEITRAAAQLQEELRSRDVRTRFLEEQVAYLKAELGCVEAQAMQLRESADQLLPELRRADLQAQALRRENESLRYSESAAKLALEGYRADSEAELRKLRSDLTAFRAGKAPGASGHSARPATARAQPATGGIAARVHNCRTGDAPVAVDNDSRSSLSSDGSSVEERSVATVHSDGPAATLERLRVSVPPLPLPRRTDADPVSVLGAPARAPAPAAAPAGPVFSFGRGHASVPPPPVGVARPPEDERLRRLEEAIAAVQATLLAARADRGPSITKPPGPADASPQSGIRPWAVRASRDVGVVDSDSDGDHYPRIVSWNSQRGDRGCRPCVGWGRGGRTLAAYSEGQTSANNGGPHGTASARRKWLDKVLALPPGRWWGGATSRCWSADTRSKRHKVDGAPPEAPAPWADKVALLRPAMAAKRDERRKRASNTKKRTPWASALHTRNPDVNDLTSTSPQRTAAVKPKAYKKSGSLEPPQGPERPSGLSLSADPSAPVNQWVFIRPATTEPDIVAWTNQANATMQRMLEPATWGQ